MSDPQGGDADSVAIFVREDGEVAMVVVCDSSEELALGNHRPPQPIDGPPIPHERVTLRRDFYGALPKQPGQAPGPRMLLMASIGAVAETRPDLADRMQALIDKASADERGEAYSGELGERLEAISDLKLSLGLHSDESLAMERSAIVARRSDKTEAERRAAIMDYSDRLAALREIERRK